MTSLHRTQVDLSGLMRVLSEALYSTPFVAVRELVQNAHDSCTRRLAEAPDADYQPDIEVRVEQGQLIVRDNGAGLTLDEIHSYLATVGTGYTRTMRERGDDERHAHNGELIGYFGLGFLSAFAVSDKVEFWSSSWRTPELAHRFISRSGETYTVEAAPTRAIGSELRLHLRTDVADFSERGIRLWLKRYCCLLPHPIRYGKDAINIDPPWRNKGGLSALRSKALAMEFAELFEDQQAPIAVIALQTDHVNGLLWVRGTSSFASSDNRKLAVYVRGMLIRDDERDLLPRWAGFIGGVVESSTLLPTASRETLRSDANFDQAADEIRQALVRGLIELARDDAASWARVVMRHNQELLGAAIVDPDLFAVMATTLTVPTTEGDLNLPELTARSGGSISISTEEQIGMDSVLMRALKRPVVLGRRFGAAAFSRIYGEQFGVTIIDLGTGTGDAQWFKSNALPIAQQQQLQAWFALPDTDILVREFAPASLPFALVSNREVALKRALEADEANKRMGQAILGLVRNFTQSIDHAAGKRLYLNASNPLLLKLFELPDERRQQAVQLLRALSLWNSGNDKDLPFEHVLAQLNDAVLNLLGN